MRLKYTRRGDGSYVDQWGYATLRKPGDEHKETFDRLNRLVTDGGGWIISPPWDQDRLPVKRIIVETLPNSNLPNVLADMGYDVDREPDGERILPGRTIEKLARNADGTTSPLAIGSTLPFVTIAHAGITKTKRWSFWLPDGGERG